MNRNVLAILFLGLAAVIAWHMDWHRTLKLTSVIGLDNRVDNTLTEKTALSVYINQLERKHFNEQGLLSSQVYTDHAFQYSNAPDTLHFEQPVFHFISSNTSWRGESKTAIGDLNSELTTLYGDVNLSRTEDALTISSEQLTVDNKKQTAYTEKSVKINNTSSQTQAVGMQLNLDTETIQLKSHVHTFYQPDTAR